MSGAGLPTGNDAGKYVGGVVGMVLGGEGTEGVFGGLVGLEREFFLVAYEKD